MFFQQRKIKMSEGADFKNVLNDNFTSAADIAYTAFRDIEGDRKTQSVFQPVL